MIPSACFDISRANCLRVVLAFSILAFASVKMYTCQLSRIMRESHAWKLETSISRIKDNISRLTHKSGRVVQKNLHFVSDLLCINFLIFITIAKAFKCLQSVRVVSVQRSSEYRRTFSAMFGSLRKVVGNLQKWLERFRKSRS